MSDGHYDPKPPPMSQIKAACLILAATAVITLVFYLIGSPHCVSGPTAMTWLPMCH